MLIESQIILILRKLESETYKEQVCGKHYFKLFQFYRVYKIN